MRGAVPPEKLHIRIPHISGYNTDKDVEKSIEWVKDILQVEPEVFEYFVLPHSVREPEWMRDDDDEAE